MSTIELLDNVSYKNVLYFRVHVEIMELCNMYLHMYVKPVQKNYIVYIIL